MRLYPRDMRPAARVVFYAIIALVLIAAGPALISIFVTGDARTVLRYIAVFGTATAMFLAAVFAFVGENRR